MNLLSLTEQRKSNGKVSIDEQCPAITFTLLSNLRGVAVAAFFINVSLCVTLPECKAQNTPAVQENAKVNLKLQEARRVMADIEGQLTPSTIDLNFVDVPLNQLLATIAQTAGLNIIGGEALSEKISVHLNDIPLDEVFDIVLRPTPYTYIKEKEIIQIISKQDLPLQMEIIELQFISAEQIKEVVTNALSKQGSVKTFSKFSEGKYSNFIVVTDLPASVEAIKGLVRKLDKKLKQVVIEAKFCEVTLNKDDELGVDWVIRASVSGASAPTSFPLVKGVRDLVQPPVTAAVPTNSTVTLGTMSFADFTTTIRALDTKSKISLIASPQVAAGDGQEAEIVIGEKIPIPIYERNQETATMVVTGYQMENVGTVLKVTPVVNSDNTVTLKIHPEVSEITGYTGPNNERPIVSSREITTMFTVENGKTVVLGGLMKQTISNSAKQVPVLGNIPLLGSIFRFKDDSNSRTELLIFITPRILEEAGKDPPRATWTQSNRRKNEPARQQR